MRRELKKQFWVILSLLGGNEPNKDNSGRLLMRIDTVFITGNQDISFKTELIKQMN